MIQPATQWRVVVWFDNHDQAKIAAKSILQMMPRVMSEGRESPRRLRAADVIEAQQHVIDQLTTRTATEPSASVEITRNAAGNAQFSIKSYAPASASEEEVDAAMENAYTIATSAYDAACAQYPHVDPKAAK